MGLNELRKRIDELDAQLVSLLNERTRVVLEIGELKVENSGEIYVPAREKEVLDRVITLNEGPLGDAALQNVYREIMSASLALERNVKIAFLGPSATFTHQAARAKFGGSVDYEACETISDVFYAVEKQTADYGVVPIENSTEGAVTHTLDRFLETPLKICAEIYLPVSQHLMAKCSLRDVKRVYSHPQVFGQCRRWLHENMPGVDLVPVSSTANAVDKAVREQDAAAIASSLAAELYDINILAHDIQDIGGNTTRFLVIGKTFGGSTGEDRTSLLFGVKHKVGALYGALEAFKQYGINMSKIESRPSKTKAWEYYFFVDIEGHAEDENLRTALRELSEHCDELRILGSYPKAKGIDA
ncbi:MAG: prephenate dehydratase [Verrucomicrobia bacterium]|nr:prephenate dehydratase [Verrucomicrobiota bacterium]